MIVKWTTNDLKTVLTAIWDPVATAQGFSFWKDGVRVSYTMDGTRTSARFGLDGKPHMFEVWALGKLDHATTAYPLPTTPAVTRPFTDASTVNKPIPATAPAHKDSQLMIGAGTNFLLAGTASDPYKEWLGPRQRAMYWKGDTTRLGTVPMFVNFVDQVGYACATTSRTVPMPAGWDVVAAQAASYDGIVWIVDENTGDSWESYRVTPPNVPSKDIVCAPSRWNSVRFDKFPGEEKTGLGYGHGYGQSGSNILTGVGLLRPEDFADLSPGSVIPHALRLNWACGSNGTIYPACVGAASSGDGQQPKGAPMGCRIQLDPSVDVNSWASVAGKPEPWRGALRKILRTLQVYGAIPVDSCGPGAGGLESCVAGSVAPYVFPWEQAGAGWGYGNGVPYDLMGRFRVVDWSVFA